MHEREREREREIGGREKEREKERRVERKGMKESNGASTTMMFGAVSDVEVTSVRVKELV